MEHVQANSVVINDLGEFINVMGFRVRKELVAAYRIGGPITDGEFEGLYTVNLMIQHGWNAAKPHTKEECEKEIERLDWIYKKDQK